LCYARTMLNCPFRNDSALPCPFEDKSYESVLLGSCDESQYGRNCAELITQLTVLGTTGAEGVRSGIDDVYGEVVGYYRPATLTLGEAPDTIKRDVVSCRLPLRESRPDVEGGVAVHHFDLICTLQNERFLSSANWYNSELKKHTEDGDAHDWWIFAQDDGEVSFLTESKDTVAQYDRTFRLGSAVLYNTAFPPLLVVENLRRTART